MTKKKSTVVQVEENSPWLALLAEAEDHLRQSTYLRAEEVANDALALTHEGTPLPPGERARALCILGSCYWNASRYDEALAYFDEALAAAEAVGDHGMQARALHGTANVRMNQGDLSTAMRAGTQSLAFAEEAEDKSKQGACLTTLGMLHFELADYDLSLKYHIRSLANAEELGEKRSIVSWLCNIGNVQNYRGNYPLALQFHSRALALATEIDHKNMIATSLINIGEVHAALANYQDALAFYDRSLARSREIGHRRFTSICLVNSANLYCKLDDYPRALDFLNRALAFAEESGDRPIVASILDNLGVVCMETGNYRLAMEYTERALTLARQIGAPRLMVDVMSSMASLQQKLGNLETAYHGLLETLHYRRDILQANDRVAGTLLDLGRLSIELGREDEGMSWLMDTLAVGEQTGEKEKLSGAHKSISEVHASRGDMALAYDHIIKHNALEKEIHTEELKKSVDQFNMRVAIAEIEHGVEVQKMRSTQLEHDLANSAIQLSAQTDLLDRFRSDLRQITRDIEEPLAALKKIKEKLRELPCQQIDWPKFEGQFTSVHPEFKTKLEAKFPTLTPQEVRMCSLVRVGLRNPEIAKLLCLSERTLESHRLNIRKKFALKTEQSLQEFLSKSI